MVHRILIFLAAAAVIALPSCRSKENGAPSGEDRENRHAASDGSAFGAAGAAEAEETGIRARNPFGRGVMHVFGIKIPTGMTPSRGPENVYRFEGRLSSARVAFLIREQIDAQKETPEGDGFLFRFATARNERIHDEEAAKLAIRVFPTDDGSTLDIWREREYVSSLPGRGTAAARPVQRRPQTRRRDVNKAAQQAKTAHRALLLQSLRKLQQGEPLTPEEAASGVYD